VQRFAVEKRGGRLVARRQGIDPQASVRVYGKYPGGWS